MFPKKELLALPALQNIDEIMKDLLSSVNLTKGEYSDLEFKVKANKLSLVLQGIDIKEFSDVWLSSYWNSRDLGYAVKLYLEHYGVAHTFVEKAHSKITDQVVFSLNDISTPDTFFIDRQDFTKQIEIIETTCNYPIIIKDTAGLGGRNSFLVNNRFELMSKLNSMDSSRKYFFQRFIPNDYDWGILVANGVVVSAEKSFPKLGEFRNNSSNGATEIFVALEHVPTEVKDMALKASEVLGLSWSRSDIVIDKFTSIPYLMEVNRCPGITSGTSEVSGAKYFLNNHFKSSKYQKRSLPIPAIFFEPRLDDIE